jgi:hypothetical protein
VLAYVFWHTPAAGADVEDYEQAQLAFHRSLARSRPVGMTGSLLSRVGEVPWLDGAAYEDWYLLEDYAALGVLNQAAVGRGHRTAHDRAAHRVGAGTAAIFALLDGAASPAALARRGLSVWVDRPFGSQPPALAEMLADGSDAACASLWRRQLVLGPAPELCLLCDEAPGGVAAARLPAGWSAQSVARTTIWHG